MPLILSGDTGVPASGMPTGSVIQTVTATTNTQVSISGTSTYTDSGLSVSITPTSSTSKILVIVNQSVYTYRSQDAVRTGVRLLRDSTVILAPFSDTTGPLEPYLETGGVSAIYLAYRHPMVFLDSPATVSSVTYKTQGALRTTTSGATLVFQPSGGGGINGTSTITLQEIKA
jgi:hypothetical protein